MNFSMRQGYLHQDLGEQHRLEDMRSVSSSYPARCVHFHRLNTQTLRNKRFVWVSE